MRRILWWLIAGTKGGRTRAKIIQALSSQPANANQLSERLGYDYKTIKHHLEILMDNRIVTSQGGRYGAVYFLTEEMERHYSLFLEIVERMG